MLHLITDSFFAREFPEVSRHLPGNLLCRRECDGTIIKLRILETEAYCGEADTACHAHRGRTPRTEPLYAAPGTLYVYLCYGIHWMLNFSTGGAGRPQGVLIRSCQGAEGPGRLTKALSIDGSFNGKSLSDCRDRLWIEDDGLPCRIETAPRVGIGYASAEDQLRPLRFIAMYNG